MAAAVQLSGFVRCRTSSQLLSDGMTLNALGSFPERYLERISPTPLNTPTTFSFMTWEEAGAGRSEVSVAISVCLSLILSMMMSARVLRAGSSLLMNSCIALSSSSDTKGQHSRDPPGGSSGNSSSLAESWSSLSDPSRGGPSVAATFVTFPRFPFFDAVACPVPCSSSSSSCWSLAWSRILRVSLSSTYSSSASAERSCLTLVRPFWRGASAFNISWAKAWCSRGFLSLPIARG